jgi:hypothetical protein
MEALGEAVERPRLPALETVLEYGLSRRARPSATRVFADLWEIGRFFDCACSPARASRLAAMNRLQRITPRVDCGCAAGAAGVPGSGFQVPGSNAGSGSEPERRTRTRNPEPGTRNWTGVRD